VEQIKNLKIYIYGSLQLHSLSFKLKNHTNKNSKKIEAHAGKPHVLSRHTP